MTYAIKVIWKDGTEEYLRMGVRSNGPIVRFRSRELAEGQRDFILEGLDADDIQSVNVVPAPERGAR